MVDVDWLRIIFRNLELENTDLSSLTVLPWDSRFSAKSHGTPRKSHDFWKTSRFSKKTYRFSLCPKILNRCSRIEPFSKTNSATKNKQIQVGQGTEPQESIFRKSVPNKVIASYQSLTFWITPTWHFGANQSGGFRRNWNSYGMFYHVLHRKRATCFCLAPKNIDNSQSPDSYWNLQIFGLPTPDFQCFKVERSENIKLR